MRLTKYLLSSTMRVALVQMRAGADKTANVAGACARIADAAKNGANLVVLPVSVQCAGAYADQQEFFNAPYGLDFFAPYAERIPSGATVTSLAECAAKNKVWLVGGSIPERSDDDKLYNTMTVYDPTENTQVHLFDINVPGKMVFQESKVLTAGSSLNTVAMGSAWRVGLGICYDLRFAEMAHTYVQKHGCQMLVYPAAFNTTTGPLHWHALARGRAIDCQSYVLMCAPSHDPTSSGYPAYGHSLVVDPWGKIIAEAGQNDETILYADIDMKEVDDVRRSFPYLAQRRTDLYDTIQK